MYRTPRPQRSSRRQCRRRGQNGVYAGALDNDFVLPPDIPPVKREAVLKIKAAIERFVEKSNRKPFSWAMIESQEQMEKEIKNIIASYPPGVFGIPSGSGLQLSEKRVYSVYIRSSSSSRFKPSRARTANIQRCPASENWGILHHRNPSLCRTKSFPTHEAAIKAAFEDCMKKTDAGSAA
jgi:hypothetical protein